MSEKINSNDFDNEEQVEKEIEQIQANAVSATGPSCIGRVLSYSQASAIRLRNIQLVNESRKYNKPVDKKVRREMGQAWRLRESGRV